MEFVEISDHGYIPVSTSCFPKLVLQTAEQSRPKFPLYYYGTHEEGGTETYEVVEETPISSLQSSPLLQLIDPNPPVLLNLVYEVDGAIPEAYKNFHVNQAFTTLAGAQADQAAMPIVPSHILDHMYARKPKDPLKVTATKPKKRAKAKSSSSITVPQTPEIAPCPVPTNKVNIIRKSNAANIFPAFRPVVSRPNILQNAKIVTSSTVNPNLAQNGRAKAATLGASPAAPVTPFTTANAQTSPITKNGIKVEFRDEPKPASPQTNETNVSSASETPVYLLASQPGTIASKRKRKPDNSPVVKVSHKLTDTVSPQSPSGFQNFCIVLPPTSSSSNGSIVPSIMQPQRAAVLNASGFTFLTRSSVRDSAEPMVTVADQGQPTINQPYTGVLHVDDQPFYYTYE